MNSNRVTPAATILASLLLSAAANAVSPAPKAVAHAQFYASPDPALKALPFSEAVRAGDLLIVSGQIGALPGKMTLAPGGISGEARQAIENIRGILQRHDATLADVVQCTVFLADMKDWPAFNTDTAFHVPENKLPRFANAYAFNHRKRGLELFDDAANSAWLPEPAFQSAGGGLVSTVDDCYAFARMMRNKGRHGTEQILSRASIALMTSDQLTPAQREGAEIFFNDNRSWAFGMAVDIKQDELYRTPGRFGWDGGFGTCMYIDPVKDMVGILLTQRMMESPRTPPVFSDFWTLAYAAIA